MEKKRSKLRNSVIKRSNSNEVNEIQVNKKLKTNSKRDKWLKKNIESNSNKTNNQRNGKSTFAIDNNNNNNEEDDDDDEIDQESEIKLDQTIDEKNVEQFTFEFYDIKNDYVEGITSLLKQTFVNPTTCFQISNAIVSSDLVGTAVVCEGGEDVFAFATIIPLSISNTNEDLSKLLNHLHKVSKSTDSLRFELKQLLSDCLTGNKSSATGLLLHKRYSNFPIQLVGNLHSNLFDDIIWARNQTDNQSNEFKSLEYVLLINQATVEDNCKFKGDTCIESPNSILCDYFEDDLYNQNSLGSVIFKYSDARSILFATIIKLSYMETIKNQIKALCKS